MRKISKYIVLSLALGFVLSAHSQSVDIERGDAHLEIFEFEKALEEYKIAYTYDTTSVIATRRIADTYRRKGDLESSVVWYERTLALDPSQKDDMLHYAEALKSQKRYEESLEWYRKYNSLAPDDERASNHIQQEELFADISDDSTKTILVKSLQVNNKKPAFGVTKIDGRIMFSAADMGSHTGNKTNPWNDLPYLDVYVAQIDNFNELINVTAINEVNSKYNDGPAHYSEVLRTLFITRNNMKRGKPVKDKTGSVNLKIYAVNKKEDGTWGDIYDLPFNSDEYSCGHPCITPDGKVMYFSSNQPGGEGGTDIYVSENINDTWSTPVNLGDKVNTKGDELFPYVDDNGVLYFSSTGHAGLGGLDIFKVNLDDIHTEEPLNIGAPMNSPKDDFSLVFHQNDASGYFCSNREKEFSDNIYYFEINNLLEKRIAGIIESSLPDRILAGTELIIRNVNTGEEESIILDETGEFEFTAEAGESYELAYQKEDSEEILGTKEIEKVISEDFENIGVFTIYERMQILANNDSDSLIINDVMYKRFSEDNRFISENQDTLSNTMMAELIARNTQKNDIEINDELFNYDEETDTYTDESGEEYTEEELEQLLMSQIFANPLDPIDASLLASQELLEDIGDYLEIPDLEPVEDLSDSIIDYVEEESPEVEVTEEVIEDLSEFGDTPVDHSEFEELTEVAEVAEVAEEFEEFEEFEEIPEEIEPMAFPEEDDSSITEDIADIDMDQIYFDFNNAAIRTDAKRTLDKITSVLLADDELKMYVDAHTDSRGSDVYNHYLSEKRATSVRDYLKSRGIEPNRLELNWYGEKELANTCTDGMSCEETDHQLNRRAKLKITKELVRTNDNLNAPLASKYVPESDLPSAPVSAPDEIFSPFEDDATAGLNLGLDDDELLGRAELEVIYYDYDSSKIRKDAELILEVVAAAMKSNSKSISINAHTDSRGKDEYNAVLSKKRAQQAKNFLMSQGVSKDRISINWSGEVQLANRCDDGVACTASEHQKNRRATLAWK